MKTLLSKRILLHSLSAAVLSTSSTLANAQTATWTGAANDNQWNNAQNWSWVSGSGVPTLNANVVIHNINAPINIGDNVAANCKNLTIDGGNSNQIEIGKGSKLTVAGDIIQVGPHSYLSDASIASGAPGSELVFTGDKPQRIRSVMIAMSKVRIAKTNGNVTIDSFCRMFIADTLFLESSPVAVGLPAKGNLEIRNGSLVRDVHGAATILPPYSDSQVPPHIICTRYPVTVGDEVSYLVADIQNNAGQEEGINGTILFPVGMNDSSYTPVTITQKGTNTNAWNVHITPLRRASCTTSPVGGAQSVRQGFYAVPLERDLSQVSTSISTPATVTISYNALNRADVSAGYSASNTGRQAYIYNRSIGCWDKITSTTQTGSNYKTISVGSYSNLEQLAIASNGNVGVPGTEPSEAAGIFPNPTTGKTTLKFNVRSNGPVTIRIVDLTGRSQILAAQDYAAGMQQLGLDISAIIPGNYLIQITDAIGTVSSQMLRKQ